MKRTSIKAILLCCMTANHIAMVFRPQEPLYSFLMCIGMICMPLFSLFLAEGFEFTRDRKKYGTRILFFTIISHFAFKLAFPEEYPITSVMTTLYISFLLLWVIHSDTNRVTKNLLAIGLLFFVITLRLGTLRSTVGSRF